MTIPLRVSFEPQAIREHFEGCDPDPTKEMSDEHLAQIGEYALQADSLWVVFHEVLLEAMAEVPSVEESDALQALSLARTALDDPGGYDFESDELYRECVRASETLDRVYAEAAPHPLTLYAIEQIDVAMHLIGAKKGEA